jgi:hypothetical protein
MDGGQRTVMAVGVLCSGLFAMTQLSYATALLPETVGEAYDLHTEQPLYSETHCVSDDYTMREVIYRNGDEALIAYKELNYETGQTTPAFVQHNINTSDSVAVAMQQGKIVMTFTNSDSAADRVVTKKPGADMPLVVDAGFDAFVKDNWDSLLAGETKRFQFPFASREMLVELEIATTGCTYDSQTDQCFVLELDNWFLKMLAAPIELGYDRDLRRLTRFRGVSNIRAADGGGLEVDIHYRYSEMANMDCAREEESAILRAITALDSHVGVERPSFILASQEN